VEEAIHGRANRRHRARGRERSSHHGDVPSARDLEQHFGALAREVPRPEAPGARRLKQLEEETRRLKRVAADLALDHSRLKDLVGRKW
jgi:hypothetical protein